MTNTRLNMPIIPEFRTESGSTQMRGLYKKFKDALGCLLDLVSVEERQWKEINSQTTHLGHFALLTFILTMTKTA